MNQQDRSELILAWFDLPINVSVQMMNSPSGSALLALLCNAGSKINRDMYVHKSYMILQAIKIAQLSNRDVWKEPHSGYGEYKADICIFISVPDVCNRIPFHVSSKDEVLADVVSRLPVKSIGWTGIQFQPIARPLTLEWLIMTGLI